MIEWAAVAAAAKSAGGWVGLVGGLTGFYTFLTAQWRRRLRVAIDYSEGNDAHNSWHRFTITNRSPSGCDVVVSLAALISHIMSLEEHSGLGRGKT